MFGPGFWHQKKKKKNQVMPKCVKWKLPCEPHGDALAAAFEHPEHLSDVELAGGGGRWSLCTSLGIGLREAGSSTPTGWLGSQVYDKQCFHFFVG